MFYDVLTSEGLASRISVTAEIKIEKYNITKCPDEYTCLEDRKRNAWGRISIPSRFYQLFLEDTLRDEADERGFKPRVSYEDTEDVSNTVDYDSNANGIGRNGRSGYKTGGSGYKNGGYNYKNGGNNYKNGGGGRDKGYYNGGGSRHNGYYNGGGSRHNDYYSASAGFGGY